MPRWLNIPNALTLFRFGRAPFALLATLAGDYRRALLLFALAGVTDGLDGLIARRFQLMTRFGAYIDPIADKTLLSTAYLAMGSAALVPWWLVWTIFGRDLFILAMAIAGLLFMHERNFPPSVWG